ncbi:hypothetical protein [Hymenobacter metallicola]|uniref:Uncharacterized protein n=1 Tax=Hymenobacter metallicola TaxID=2563114 RepID=A0A4Z0PZY9_9BACT|nr:hypothetical protein [Hymenobacter metallicola]TGE22806.1 hypothetical protein E5K02_20795 [Hymenobacter metallicola]
MKVPAIEILKEAFDELNEWQEHTSTPEDLWPSAMLLVVEPSHNPNARARITGDPDLLVQVLHMALKDPSNAEFVRAFNEAFQQPTAELQEAAREVQRWAQELNNAQVKIQQLYAEINDGAAYCEQLERDNQRLTEETHRWSDAVKKLESQRTQQPAAVCHANIVFRRRHEKIHCRLFKWELKPGPVLNGLLAQDELEGKRVRVTIEVLEPAMDMLLSKRALKALSFQQKVALCDEVGVHFALLDAVLLQPGAQQSSFTATQFSHLMNLAAARYEVVANMLEGGEGK